MEPLNNLSMKADPVSPLVENEQLSKLPDCVPLEIKSESDLHTSVKYLYFLE